jgi:hypothetical protein
VAGLLTVLFGTVLWLLGLTGLVVVLTAGLVLMALGLVAALIVARSKPTRVLYHIVERVGFCAEAEIQELVLEAPLLETSTI